MKFHEISCFLENTKKCQKFDIFGDTEKHEFSEIWHPGIRNSVFRKQNSGPGSWIFWGGVDFQGGGAKVIPKGILYKLIYSVFSKGGSKTPKTPKNRFLGGGSKRVQNPEKCTNN